jgi:hypothetical protein
MKEDPPPTPGEATGASAADVSLETPVDPAIFLAIAESTAPARDPRVAAFRQIVEGLLRLLVFETRPDRRGAVTDHAFLIIEDRLSVASGHETHLEQEAALRDPLRALAAGTRPGDLRRHKDSRAPANLLSEYEQLRVDLTSILGPRVPDHRRAAKDRITAAAAGLKQRFPELRRLEDRREAAAATPAEAAKIILGKRYHLTPKRVRDLLSEQRRQHRELGRALASLPSVPS